MPTRRKKKSLRVSSAASTKDDAKVVAAAVAAGIDPMTLVTGGTQTDSPSAKPKKKTKLTKAEKALAKLEKSCDTFMKSGAPYNDFITRLDQWLKDNHRKMLGIFKTIDTDGEGYVTFDEFKAVVLDKLIPCTTLELQTLCKLLDPEDAEEINYEDLNEGLKHIQEREATYASSDVRPSLMTSTRQYDHCPTCKMAIWDGQPYKPEVSRYVEVLFRLVTFDSFKAHPGHFTKVVHSHKTGLGLLQVIQDHTDIQSLHLSLFTDKSRESDALIPVDLSLEEMGYEGGSKNEPQELLLYYDYKVEFTDCPILLCDHYFGQKTKIHL